MLQTFFSSGDHEYLREASEDDVMVDGEFPLVSGFGGATGFASQSFSDDGQYWFAYSNVGTLDDAYIYKWNGVQWAEEWAGTNSGDLAVAASINCMNYDGTMVANQGLYVIQRIGSVWDSSMVRHTLTVTGSYSYMQHFSKDGSRLIVGREGYDGAYTNCGAVDIYVWSGTAWSREQVISPPSPQADGYFGNHVNLNEDGSTCTITSRLGTKQVCYVYTRSGSTWSLHSTLDPNTTPFAGVLRGRAFINRAGDRVAFWNAGLSATRNSTLCYYGLSGGTWSLLTTSTIVDADADVTAEYMVMDVDAGICISSHLLTDYELYISKRNLDNTWTTGSVHTVSGTDTSRTYYLAAPDGIRTVLLYPIGADANDPGKAPEYFNRITI